jgi:hypothetical protein
MAMDVAHHVPYNMALIVCQYQMESLLLPDAFLTLILTFRLLLKQRLLDKIHSN